jgi:hypothetical protein
MNCVDSIAQRNGFLLCGVFCVTFSLEPLPIKDTKDENIFYRSSELRKAGTAADQGYEDQDMFVKPA